MASVETTSVRGHGFGMMPVFLAGISTILGAVMFLRFGYAVGHVGFPGALLIILIGHLVTIPTALALAEIATNRRVEGGGEYFIISRSFGTSIGSVIGISLYISQAISVAFYMIAFAEAFSLLAPVFERTFGLRFVPQMVSLPATVVLLVLMLTKGASVGVKALYVVVSMLGVSLVLFFLGSPIGGYEASAASLTERVADADPFFIVFAIVFPAFTGMTAGVGLSGDLANPRKSIPAGTMAATFIGMLMYVVIVAKLALSAPAPALAENQLIMADIALWGPIIPIGLGFATLSSAIGSILVAPRTLQAIGTDEGLPLRGINKWISRGQGKANEPQNATLLTGILALVVVALGSVDIVARLISMFFMVTYGSLCAISFLEHFASRPSYRPSFRSRWYISLFGALMCLFMMFQMDPLFAMLAILMLIGLYRIVVKRRQKDDLAAMFEGVLTQATRFLQIRLQPRRLKGMSGEWRPSILMVDARTFDRKAPITLLQWLCHRHGFGTYMHYIEGQLNVRTYRESKLVEERLMKMARELDSPVYMDTIISPSMVSALAQSLQVPGISGLDNNTIMFECSIHDPPEVFEEVVSSCLFAASTLKTLLVLRHGDHFFGKRRRLHIWLTWNDWPNANLMLLLSYILLGHPDWSKADITVSCALPEEELEDRRRYFAELIQTGRLPVAEQSIEFYPVESVTAYRELVARESKDADLTIIGFSLKGVREKGAEQFTHHPALRDVLFVQAPQEITFE